MAFFKFRKAGDDAPAAAAQPESVETLRRRARHRLIGAAVLVLLGVIGFPILFDTQPRPVAVDIPIEIPDRNKAKPLAPATPVAGGDVKAGQPAPAVATAPSSPVAAAKSQQPVPAPATKAPVAAGPVAVAPEPPKVEAKPVAPGPGPAQAAAPARQQPATAAPTPTPAPAADAARAQALLEGKPVQADAQEAGKGRFIVQVGAFADGTKAREARLKVEKTGLKTYTQEAETREGKRIRVRVGPFATRAEADKAAGRIKELDLPANVLTL